VLNVRFDRGTKRCVDGLEMRPADRAHLVSDPIDVVAALAFELAEISHHRHPRSPMTEERGHGR
jgi:hypothetical protein